MANLDEGIKRAVTLQNSRVKNVFTPHMPIKTFAHFIGRSDHVAKLMECLITPGNHALLYGDRGVGKSSLANAVTNLLLKQLYAGKGRVSHKSCDSTDTFSSVMEQVLRDVGVELDLDEKIRESKIGASTKVGGEGFELGVTGERKTGEKFKIRNNLSSPSWVGGKLKDISCMIVIDEFDAIHDQDERKKMAELLKYLSDNSVTCKIMLVGIGKTASDLTAGHPSVRRCLMELHLERMQDDELKKIIIDGSQKLGLVFEDDVILKIVEISAGYPYFTHLISLKCAEQAILNGRRHITIDKLNEALSQAVASAESSLTSLYLAATRGRKEAEYKKLLLAAATCNGSEFSTGQVRNKLSEILGVEIETKRVPAYLNDLTCDEDSKVFRRISRGVYQFSDPRMPSFIKMASA